MDNCKDCSDKIENKFALKREKIIAELQTKFANEDVTVAIAKTKNGADLCWRKVGDESLQRLEVREYISIIKGVAIR